MDATVTLRGWLTAIYEAHGYLTPELVREAARPPTSPAHGYVFGLPPDQAAEAHYLERAHELIRRVKVVVATAEGEPPRRLRFFHAIPGEEEAYVYEPLTTLQRSPDKLEAARTEALRRLKDAQAAVEDFDLIAGPTPARSRTAKAVKAVKRARELVEA